MSNEMKGLIRQDLLTSLENRKYAETLKDNVILNKVNVDNTRDSKKKKVDVLIDGVIYTLVSKEDESYMQKVAFYLNQKISETKKADSCRNLDTRAIALLTSMNIADEYFKVQEKNKEQEIRIKQLESDVEIYKREYKNADKDNELLKAQIENLNIKLLRAENPNTNSTEIE